MNKNILLVVIGAIILAALGLNFLNTRQAGVKTQQKQMEVDDVEDKDKIESKEVEERDESNKMDKEEEKTGTKVIEIEGRNFAFSKKEIEVDKGTKVKIVLKNVEGFPHDWTVDEFNVRTKQISPGQTDTVEFVADKAGTFEYYCSVGNHRQMGMKGKLIVEE